MVLIIIIVVVFVFVSQCILDFERAENVLEVLDAVQEWTTGPVDNIDIRYIAMYQESSIL